MISGTWTRETGVFIKVFYFYSTFSAKMGIFIDSGYKMVTLTRIIAVTIVQN